LQFKFNLVVGVAISVLGALITQIDPAGVGLFSVGVALTSLTVLTMLTAKQGQVSNQPRLLPIQSSQTGVRNPRTMR
ncbi:MAG: hypothetical protein ACI8WB_005929, partial [Phenylobacterium sp.]